jgi:hypothetical protein
LIPHYNVILPKAFCKGVSNPEGPLILEPFFQQQTWYIMQESLVAGAVIGSLYRPKSQ